MIKGWRHGVLAVLAMSSSACATARLKPACIDKNMRDSHLREPKADYWISALMRGPDRDCRGEPIEWKKSDERCTAVDDLGTPLPPTGRIGVEDVTINRHARTERLVWVVSRRHSNGEGEGPVALAELDADAVRIVGLGTLRALGGATRLKLLELGDKGKVLAAEGKHCPDGFDACVSAMRLMVLRGTYFVSVPMRDPTGACAGPARIDIERRKTVDIDQGYKMTTQLSSSWTVKEGQLVVTESVVVFQFDPKRPEATRQQVRTAEQTRTIRWSAGYLVADKSPLWDSVVKDG